MPLTARQKAKLIKSNPNFLGTYFFIRKMEQEHDQKIQKLQELFDQKLKEMKEETLITLERVRRIQKGDKPVAGVDYPVPRDGYSPTRDELLAMIEPLIPQARDGHTPTRRELLALIEPLVPAGVDEQALVQKVLSQLKLPDTPTAEAIVDMVMKKIEERKIAVADVEGLAGMLSTINKNIGIIKQQKAQAHGGGGGGGMGNIQTDNFTGNGSTVAFTLTSRVASSGKAILVLLNGQVQEITTHYTISSKTLTFTTAPFAGAAIHVWYIRT